MKRWFPRPVSFGRADAVTDASAGLTLGILLIPQAMAYGLLAGVPPQYGLYAALLPMLVYALLASTPHVTVGPTALASLLCLNGLAGLAEPFTPEYLGYAVVLAGLTGVLQLLFGILRLGGLVSLLSRPVLSGFVSAAAVLIIVSQLDTLLGVRAEGSYLHETLISLWRARTQVHGPTALLGVATLVALVVGQRVLPRRFPLMLALIVVATVVVGLAGNPWGIATLETIPAGLPRFAWPTVATGTLLSLLPVALVLALISFIETLSIGKTFAPNYAYYRVRPNRELVALGLSKVVGALGQAIPTSASFSRSAVVEGAGGRTALTNVVAVGLLVLVLLFLTPWFYHLPIPVLAAIIIFSVRNLFDWAEMRRLYRLAPKELLTLLITFLFTLFAGLQYGIAGGVLLSLAFVLLRAARPHLAELGRVAGTNAFRNRQRFAGAEIDPAVLIVRFDAELYFGNAEYFRDRLQALVDARGPGLRAVIIDGHTINDVDTTGLFVLTQFMESLAKNGTELFLCGVIGPVRDKLYRCGLMERMGAEHNFLSIQAALRHIAGEGGGRDWDLPAVQHE